MRKTLICLCTLLFASVAGAQTEYTKEYTDAELVRQATEWVNAGAWRNGFTAASPHESVNVVEFYLQYQQNKAQWDAAFSWLATHDLLTVAAGKHPIEGTDLTVSVEDSENGPLEKRGTESHYHHVDLQYVVSGSERFAIIDHLSSKPNCEYRPDVIHYDYDAEKALFYDSTPDRFFLFFPCDWHIAKINTDGPDQTIRVIVIKPDYVEAGN